MTDFRKKVYKFEGVQKEAYKAQSVKKEKLRQIANVREGNIQKIAIMCEDQKYAINYLRSQFKDTIYDDLSDLTMKMNMFLELRRKGGVEESLSKSVLRNEVETYLDESREKDPVSKAESYFYH